MTTWMPLFRSRNSLTVFVISTILLLCRNATAIDDAADWARWSKSSVSQPALDLLTQQMMSAGLSPLRRDPRHFQPKSGAPLQVEQIPRECIPFGLSLAAFNTTDEQLTALKGNESLFKLTLLGFRNGKSCIQAVHEQTALRFLSLTDCAITDEHISQLAKLKHLEELDLRKTLVSGRGLSELRSLPALKSLEIDMTEDQFQTLIANQLVHLLPFAHGENRAAAATDDDILELELNGYYGFRVTNEMLRNLHQLTSLRHLSLIESEINNDAGAQLIRLPRLQTLNLERTQIDDDALRILASSPRLTSVTLDETRITANGLKQLSKWIGLKELHLNRCKLDDASLEALGALPSLERLHMMSTLIRFEDHAGSDAFPKLQHLNLNGSAVTDRGIASIAELVQLKWLDLTQCDVSDVGIKSLSTCRTLEELYLNQTPISDMSLLHLRSIKTLKVLSLHNTAITDAGLAHLSGSTNLRSLVLFGTQTSEQAVQRLRLTMPQCEIAR